jgi:hypothetical protein
MEVKKNEKLVELYEAFSVKELEERLDLQVCFICKCAPRR